MVDLILSDVKALILGKHGDPRFLQQILRALENGEVLSVHERGYVEKLAKQHLRPEPEIPTVKGETKIEKGDSNPSSAFRDTGKTVTNYYEKRTDLLLGKQEERPPSAFSTMSKQKKIIIGIAALVVIVGIGGGVGIASSGDISFGNGSSSPDVSSTTVSTSTSGLTLELDNSSYSKGDLISISGTSDIALGNIVSLSITNSANGIAWSEDLKIKSSGSFSTLAIAGGPGWETSGKYTLKILHGDKTDEIVFDFT